MGEVTAITCSVCEGYDDTCPACHPGATEQPDEVKARCPDGHLQRWWGGLLIVKRGEIPRVHGGPIGCSTTGCPHTLGVQR